MKTTIKATIGIITIALSSLSVAQAGQERSGHKYNKPQHERQYSHHDKRIVTVVERPRFYSDWKRPYLKRSQPRVEKYIYLRNNYAPPRHAIHHVIIKDHQHNHSILPVLTASLIGSSIGNHISEGDPAATFGGAVFGAIIGNAISGH